MTSGNVSKLLVTLLKQVLCGVQSFGSNLIAFEVLLASFKVTLMIEKLILIGSTFKLYQNGMQRYLKVIGSKMESN